MAWLSRETGIATSTLSDIGKGKVPRADRAVKIARALGSSVEALFGTGAPSRAPLIDAASADWVELPRYDLRRLTDAGKGDPVDVIPLRRDWLNRRLLTSSDLWITEIPSDYAALGLAEGDVVMCSDIVAGVGPAERWICIFRGAGGPFLARYSNRSSGELGPGDLLGDAFVTTGDLQSGDVFAVARIHARLLAKI